MKEIDYSKMDPGVVNLVKYFNDIGLETSISCQGHGTVNQSCYWIEFSKSVAESNIVNFMTRHSHKVVRADNTIGNSFISNGWFCKNIFLKGRDDKIPYYRWRYIVGTVEAANADCEKWKRMDEGEIFWNGPNPEEFRKWKENREKVRI